MSGDTPETVAKCVGLAQKFQSENGGFLPFGQVLELGELKYQAVDGEGAKEIIKVLNGIYCEKAARGILEWAALCTDVRVTDHEAYPNGTDAIHVAYEDRSGRSESYFVPYQERADGLTEYQPSFARNKPRRWFT